MQQYRFLFEIFWTWVHGFISIIHHFHQPVFLTTEMASTTVLGVTGITLTKVPRLNRPNQSNYSRFFAAVHNLSTTPSRSWDGISCDDFLFSPSHSAIPVAWYLYFGGVLFAFDLWRKSGGNKTLVTFMLIGFDGANKMLQSFILMTLGNCPPCIETNLKGWTASLLKQVTWLKPSGLVTIV